VNKDQCVFCEGSGKADYRDLDCCYCWGTGEQDDAAPECYRMWKQDHIIMMNDYNEKLFIKYLRKYPRKFLRNYRMNQRKNRTCMRNIKWKKK